jgi:predicted RecA/RadA family phage recombinase
MKNFVQPGNTVAVSAPRALKSGDGFVKGKLFGVSANDVKSGDAAQMSIEGVFLFKRAAGVTLNEGDPVTFDEGTQTVVAAGTVGMKVIGVCVEAEQVDSAPGYSAVKLIPSAA